MSLLLTEAARASDIAAAFAASGQDLQTRLTPPTAQQVLPADVFAPAPGGTGPPSLDDFIAYAAPAVDAQMAELRADLKSRTASFGKRAAGSSGMAQKHLGPMLSLPRISTQPSSYVPCLVLPTEAGDGRFHISVAFMSADDLARALQLVRDWFDRICAEEDAAEAAAAAGGAAGAAAAASAAAAAADAPNLSEHDAALLEAGRDLLGGFDGDSSDPMSDDLYGDDGDVLPTAQWRLPWALRLFAGARLEISFAAPTMGEGAEETLRHLLFYTFGEWSPWAAIARGGLRVLLPTSAPAMLDAPGIRRDGTSRNRALRQSLEDHAVHRIVMLPFQDKLAVDGDMVRSVNLND